mmetsp:Transcript_13789/g.21019  ORF Transcript_13789/g.21019 Transcript_13789/m.21019 type:complete len:300 (-) Transcript_13789:37-936(-)
MASLSVSLDKESLSNVAKLCDKGEAIADLDLNLPFYASASAVYGYIASKCDCTSLETLKIILVKPGEGKLDLLKEKSTKNMAIECGIPESIFEEEALSYLSFLDVFLSKSTNGKLKSLDVTYSVDDDIKCPALKDLRHLKVNLSSSPAGPQNADKLLALLEATPNVQKLTILSDFSGSISSLSSLTLKVLDMTAGACGIFIESLECPSLRLVMFVEGSNGFNPIQPIDENGEEAVVIVKGKLFAGLENAPATCVVKMTRALSEVAEVEDAVDEAALVETVDDEGEYLAVDPDGNVDEIP